MATLESAYNSQYSENASILTGDYDRVTVEVEDSIDAEFWHGLLSGLCPQKNFHFDPYRTVLKEDGTEQRVSGKSRIIESAKTFNQWHIGCVDSDYEKLRESDNYHKSALREYQAKQKSVRKLLAKNNLYKGDIYNSISRDVSAIWKTE